MNKVLTLPTQMELLCKITKNYQWNVRLLLGWNIPPPTSARRLCHSTNSISTRTIESTISGHVNIFEKSLCGE
jgi:hypothetical protein